jgi:hypothetical protein
MHRSVLDDEEAAFTFGVALARTKTFDPSEPRDEEGKWTDAGGSDGGSDESSATGAAAAPEKAPNPTVTAVGGDEWNKQTAARLEQEYVAAHSALDTIVKEAIGGKVSVAAPSESPDDDEPVAPDSWDTLSGSQQDDAEEQFQKSNYDSYFQSEVDNWQSETAPDDARYKVAQDYQSGDETEWVKDAIDGWREDRTEEGKPDIPYTNEQIMDALTIEHDTGHYPKEKGTSFDLDEKALAPQLANQQDLPGIESGITALNTLDRISLIGAISEAFNEQAEDVEKDLEPPDYLADSVKEYMEESWSSMDDDEKYNWVLHNTDIVEGASSPAEDVKLNQLPQTFDPLEKGGSATDYKLTQAIAKKLSIERAAQVLVERGIVKDIDAARTKVENVDRELWSAWKSSSTSNGGKLLQVAVAEELGGKLREHEDLKAQQVIADADTEYKAIGGFNGVKAYVRGKWETSQYLLDKAGIQTVSVYRGVNISPAPTWSIAEVNQTSVSAPPVAPEQAGASGNMWRARSTDGDTRYFATKDQADNFVKVKEEENPPEPLEKVESPAGREYYKYPDISVRRNGAASTTTDPKVANDWDGATGRVVLRAEVPRTAVVSVPAYGINVHSEHEVVVAGTAWVGWDAWKGRAPEFTEVPMKHGGVAA